MVGLQAQDIRAARLAVRARASGLTAATVHAASGDGAVVATWLMRGTLHLVAAADVRWLVTLFGPRNLAAGARRRRELGLDAQTCTTALAAIERILAARGPLSRGDLVAAVNAAGVPVDPSGQAPAHLMAYAAARGLICRGPFLTGDEPGYVLLDQWVPPQPDLDDDAALAELTRRYVTGFGPTTPADLATWSGLPLGAAGRGFALAATDLAEVAPGTFVLAGTLPPSPSSEPVARLLGAYDTYLLGYRDRAVVLDKAYATRVAPGGGLIHPALLVDGRAVARWRLCRTDVAIEPFVPLDPAWTAAIDAETADLAHFLA